MASRVEDLESRCAVRGRPLTHQRRAVLLGLMATDTHPTADELHAALVADNPRLSRATVYRTLDVLVELGVARRVGHSGVAVRFDARLDPHHHLICRACGRIADLEKDAASDVVVRTPRAFRVDQVSITAWGVCGGCTSVA